MATNRPPRRQAGVTLVDAAVTLAVSSVALGAALPNFDAMRARRHVEGAAAQLETELQYARSSAVALNRTVRVTFHDDNAGSCYVIHTGAADDCRCSATGSTSCASGVEQLRAAHFEAGGPVRVASNSRSMAYSADFGTVTPTGTIELRNRRGESVRLVVNIMGRVRSCAVTPGIAGLPRC